MTAPRIEVVNLARHGHLRVDPVRARQVCADLTMVPVVVSEYLRLAVQCPLVLTKHGETGRFVTSALLGLEPGENLLWDDDWPGDHPPLHIARHPLSMGRVGEGTVVCIDAANPGVGGVGEALFEGGVPSPYLERQQAMLGALIVGEAATAAFVDRLLALGLVMPITLDIELDDRAKSTVRGLYSIDEEALGRLAPEALAGLQAAGYLAAAYAMIVSLGHINGLVARKNARSLRERALHAVPA